MLWSNFVFKRGRNDEKFGQDYIDNNYIVVGFDNDLDESGIFSECMAELVGMDTG